MIRACFVLSVLAFLAACESKDSTYPTYAVAREQEALGNWLPLWLPTTATEIREHHEVDQALAWITYEAPRGESLPSDLECRPASPADLSSSVFELAPPQWWPLELVRIDAAVARRWNLLACDGGFVALNRKGDVETVYLWRTLD